MYWKAIVACILVAVVAVALIIISAFIITRRTNDTDGNLFLTERDFDAAKSTEFESLGFVASEYNTDLFEGDIVLEKNIEDTDDKGLQILYEGIRREFIWPDAIVPYELESYTFNRHGKAMIADAIEDISRRTCVRFRERTAADGSYYLRIYGPGVYDGCWSFVGKMGYPPPSGQQLSLGHGCMYKGTVRHELMHALGFNHEQSRTDRDRYVRIIYENIEYGRANQFEKSNSWEVTNLGTEYDFGSVMHYSSDAFSKYPYNKPTMVRVDGSPLVVQRIGFSDTDIYEINKLYNCPSVGDDQTTTPPTRPTHPQPRTTITPVTTIHQGDIHTFEGHEYIYVANSKSWTDAEKECVRWGGHLVSIHSHDEGQVVSFLYASHNHAVWIGYHFDHRWRQYRWSDGSNGNYMKNVKSSATGHKNDNGYDNSCSVQELLFRRDNKRRFVFNVRCEEFRSFVCKRKQR